MYSSRVKCESKWWLRAWKPVMTCAVKAAGRVRGSASEMRPTGDCRESRGGWSGAWMTVRTRAGGGWRESEETAGRGVVM